MNIISPIIIEIVTPQILEGKSYAKCPLNETFEVSAIIFKGSHDVIEASLLYKSEADRRFCEVPMKQTNEYLGEWKAEFKPDKENTFYTYTVEAWTNPLKTLLNALQKKVRANAENNYANEIKELTNLLKELKRKNFDLKEEISTYMELLELAGLGRLLESKKFLEIIEKHPIKRFNTRYMKELRVFVPRQIATFGAWYEFFPRSETQDPLVSGNFKTAIQRLHYIQSLGFDVVYLPPIHPIGITNRKGKNNSLVCEHNDVGSPWAIGSKEGGFKSIHPDPGSFQDFSDFLQEANKLKIEVALDLTFQCSPDHPYVKDHPEWFYKQADGSIKYAENPPKKYQDVYPLDFHCKEYESLWLELKSVVEFWIEKGVKIFRVDNPHTKSFTFWEWLLIEISKKYPEVIFLSEAFTRIVTKQYLAKIGFHQSYTYFTWKNSKEELIAYFTELMQTEMRDYFHANLFTNTPDILHEYLQKVGEKAFQIRTVLAGTLSSTYGIYSGFEFGENIPVKEGSEEYLDSEKYQIRVRNWSNTTEIQKLIKQLNQIRRNQQALQMYKNLTFYKNSNPNIICYGKTTPDQSNHIVIAVNLDYQNAQEDTIELPATFEGKNYKVQDLLTGEVFNWYGCKNYIKLDPRERVAHILKI